jgi:hypothetical protein
MKRFTLLAMISMATATVHAAEAPAALDFLPVGELVKGATTVVVPPPEIEKYVAIVEEAARGNPEWFREHAAKAAPGVPLPYDPKLGLSEEQYAEYLALWAKREFKPVDPVILQLKEGSDGRWAINAAVPGGGSSPISTLKYHPDKDVFVSPNGELKRLEDVKSDKESILGEWSGHEWRFEEETSLGATKENFAIGKTGDGKFGVLIYRMQETTSEGTRLYDKSVVIRYPMGEAGILKAAEGGTR